ncbi:hypothetical protein CLOM_g13705 [Closterium sp. NIES-68]|nr:hypothetical protein CLOM_g13705 [Closterium sp. NIES-68]
MSWSLIKDLPFSLLSIGRGSGETSTDTGEAPVASDSSAVTVANEGAEVTIREVFPAGSAEVTVEVAEASCGLGREAQLSDSGDRVTDGGETLTGGGDKATVANEVAKVTIREVFPAGSAEVTAVAEASCGPERESTVADGVKRATELQANDSRTRGEEDGGGRAGGWERLDEAEAGVESSGEDGDVREKIGSGVEGTGERAVERAAERAVEGAVVSGEDLGVRDIQQQQLKGGVGEGEAAAAAAVYSVSLNANVDDGGGVTGRQTAEMAFPHSLSSPSFGSTGSHNHHHADVSSSSQHPGSQPSGPSIFRAMSASSPSSPRSDGRDQEAPGGSVAARIANSHSSESHSMESHFFSEGDLVRMAKEGWLRQKEEKQQQQQQIMGPLPLISMSWQRLVGGVEALIKGSSDDIGWLGRTPGLPPVTDVTDNYEAILQCVMTGIHTLPDDLVYLLIPGLFSNLSPLYLFDTKRHFSSIGLVCHIAKIHSQAPIEANAIVIRDYIEELFWATKKKVLILGHSKGAMDAAAAISLYQPLLLDKVAGLVFIQSPYGGSPVASDLLREGQWGDVASRTILGILMDKIFKGDIQCLDDLTHAKRKAFLAAHPFPVGEIPTLSFHTEASKAAAVVASLSTVAHTEVPWLAQQNARLAVGFPLSAGLAIMALHLEYRYGAPSDGLVTRADAEVPGSVVVRSRRKLDHAFMVFPPTSGVGGGGGEGGGGGGGGGNGGGGNGGGGGGGGSGGEVEVGSAHVHEASAAEMCEALATTLLATLQMRPKQDSS